MTKRELTQDQKNAAISAKILALVTSGKSLREALDETLGSGTFERIAGEVYDGLRK